MKKPSREEAMKAVTTLIEWAGDDPKREGLVETPKELLKLMRSFLLVMSKIQKKSSKKLLKKLKDMTMVLVKDIAVESHCEHHIVPILGKHM